MSRFARRVDANHAIIRAAVRAVGYAWYDTFRNGEGIGDGLVVSKSGILTMLEIKMPGEQLTPAEREFWAGYRGPGAIVYGPEEALDYLSQLDEVKVTWRMQG